VVQSGLAQAEVNLRAARGFVLQSMADIWKDLVAGNDIAVAQRVTIRMAATHAIHKRAKRSISPIMPPVPPRISRASTRTALPRHHTVTQQLQGRLSHFETVGAWMMGVDADLTFV